jgi:hypothetical protein
MKTATKCPGCAHDASLETVLAHGYSDFHDHSETCGVLVRHLAKVASDARDRVGVLGRALKGEGYFYWPEPDAYASLIESTDMLRNMV